MFATNHYAFAPDDANVVGIALRAEKKTVDKITRA
jgi:hypothetical protein